MLHWTVLVGLPINELLKIPHENLQIQKCLRKNLIKIDQKEPENKEFPTFSEPKISPQIVE